MIIMKNEPARKYRCGKEQWIEITDCGSIELMADEQVTFHTQSGAEYDLAAKSWGFYATPSLNGRLAGFGLHGVLVKNLANRFFMMLVEEGKEKEFDEYLSAEELEIICWLDSDENLSRLEKAIKG
ncbi:MAG: hypothetical protein ACM3UZ_13010 [Acidobacteriota bacterium]